MTPKDNLAMMVDEVRAIVDTYLDGAGLFAYREDAAGTAYQAVPMPWRARVAHLDDVLHRIANEINDLAGPEGAVPPPRIPDRRAVDPQALTDDVRS